MSGTSTRPVMIITHRSVRIYPSLIEASEATGISCQRLIRALESDDGFVPSSRGNFYADDVPDELISSLNELKDEIKTT